MTAAVQSMGHLAQYRFSASQDVWTVARCDKTYPPWSILLTELRRLRGTIGTFECSRAYGHAQKGTRKRALICPHANRGKRADTLEPDAWNGLACVTRTATPTPDSVSRVTPQVPFARRLRRALALLSARAQRPALDRIAALRDDLERLRSDDLGLLRSHVAKMDADQAELAMSVNHVVLEISPSLADIQRLRAEDRAEVTSLLALLRSEAGSQAEAGQPLALAVEAADQAAFYEGFEARFRGSRATVREKLVMYVDDVAELRHGQAPLLDVGPGRCEWLELLKEHEIPAFGVDTNPRFVAIGQELGLDVRLGDALAHLRGLPEGELGAITAFQVVEHIPSEALFDLVSLALRALRPGGTLILETPNPLNLMVGSAQFWIDPSHIRPVHPQFLEYLCINRGFTDVQLRFAHPSDGRQFDVGSSGNHTSDELRRLAETLNHLLFDAMDYAVLAKAPPSHETRESLPTAAHETAAR
jgi:SAM-dependent methyltransferase